MAASLEQLVEKLRKALDPDLISVVLTGSGPQGITKRSSRITTFFACCSIGPAHQGDGNDLPLVAGAGESLAAAADGNGVAHFNLIVFPSSFTTFGSIIECFMGRIWFRIWRSIVRFIALR